MNKKKLNLVFINFWEKSYDFSQFSFIEKLLFFILVFIENIYKIIFYLVLIYKKNFLKPKQYPFKVISVGNISVGGTGKSVFVQFLVKNFSAFKCAIVMRGYKSKAEGDGKNYLIDLSTNKDILDQVGDEAVMLLNNLQCSIVVGANRAKSCDLLDNSYDIVFLDDAYQNFLIKKDFEILLLDATRPFSNGHCLPAGKLREKDISRADIIILTHADKLSVDALILLKNKLSINFDNENIFFGKHEFSGLYLWDKNFTSIEFLQNKKILAFAGIGSFDSFKNSLKDIGLKNLNFIEFQDHCNYTQQYFDNILNYYNSKNIDVLITTQKDWVKISKFFNNNIFIYVLRIEFNFLDHTDEKKFLTKLKNKLL
ncbi:tetraacyldisaccharide 4'-kinase [Candidatus Dependentiae bacterium]|nr:tetraacyldisaccharide 4'-kinase [Candidatus Dependentiae bacterium]